MRPRLTQKVIRGLAQLLAAIPHDTRASLRGDATSAVFFIDQVNRWAVAPKRKRPVPPQLVKALRRRTR